MTANKILEDFVSYVESSPEIFNSLPPLLKTNYKNAKKYLKSNTTQQPVSEKVADKFTPYTPEECKQNFSPFFGGDKRSAFERNPSYEKALKAAQEKKRQKEQQKKLSESQFKDLVKSIILKEGFDEWNYGNDNEWNDNTPEVPEDIRQDFIKFVSEISDSRRTIGGPYNAAQAMYEYYTDNNEQCLDDLISHYANYLGVVPDVIDRKEIIAAINQWGYYNAEHFSNPENDDANMRWW